MTRSIAMTSRNATLTPLFRSVGSVREVCTPTKKLDVAKICPSTVGIWVISMTLYALPVALKFGVRGGASILDVYV